MKTNKLKENWITLGEILVAYKIGRITLEEAIWIINKLK